MPQPQAALIGILEAGAAPEAGFSFRGLSLCHRMALVTGAAQICWARRELGLAALKGLGRTEKHLKDNKIIKGGSEQTLKAFVFADSGRKDRGIL